MIAARSTLFIGTMSMSTANDSRTTIGDNQSEQDATLSYIVAKNGKLLSTILMSPEVRNANQADVTLGTVLNSRYELQNELGKGGMGQVFLGMDRRLSRLVAVKIIRPDHWEVVSSAGIDQFRKAFEDEARLGANLLHPGIATVYDYGFHEDRPYIVFEYVHGKTLRDVINEKGPLPIEDVRDIIGQLSESLDYAHERGIIHRDLKPENIRIAEGGQCKVLDFGLAKDFRTSADWHFAGTPAYASPEQAAELPSDGRADQYALGLITYELLTGRRVFLAQRWPEMLERHKSIRPAFPQKLRSPIPDAVETAVLRALKKDPNARFTNCSGFALAIGSQIQNGIQIPPVIIKRGPALERVRFRDTFWYIGGFRLAFLILQKDTLLVATDDGVELWPTTAIASARLSRVSRKWYGPSLAVIVIQGPHETKRRLQMRNLQEAKEWINTIRESMHSSDLQASTHIEGYHRTLPVLLSSKPNVRMQLQGTCEATEFSTAVSRLALQADAAMLDADAVVDVSQEIVVEPETTMYRTMGTAARAIGSAAKGAFLYRFFAPKCRTICKWLVVVVFVSFIMFLLGVLKEGTSNEVMPTYVYFSMAFVIIIHSIPIAMVFVLWKWCWPQWMLPTSIVIAILVTHTYLYLGLLFIIGVVLMRLDLLRFVLLTTISPEQAALAAVGLVACDRLRHIARAYLRMSSNAIGLSVRSERRGIRYIAGHIARLFLAVIGCRVLYYVIITIASLPW